MIQKQLITPGLNTVVVYSRDVITRDMQGEYARRQGVPEISYCIDLIERDHGRAYRMSPFNRSVSAKTEPYVEDTRSAEVLKGSLIVVDDPHNSQILDCLRDVQEKRQVFIPDLSKLSMQVAHQEPAPDNEQGEEQTFYRKPMLCLSVDVEDPDLYLADIRQNIQSSDYVIVSYSNLEILSAVLQQEYTVVTDTTELSMLQFSGKSLCNNAFANPEMTNVAYMVKNVASMERHSLPVAKKLLKIEGTIFKYVVYYDMSQEQFSGTVFGQVHLVTLKRLNAYRGSFTTGRGGRGRGMSFAPRVEIETHEMRDGKRSLAEIRDPTDIVKDLLTQATRDVRGECLIKDSLRFETLQDAEAICDISINTHTTPLLGSLIPLQMEQSEGDHTTTEQPQTIKLARNLTLSCVEAEWVSGRVYKKQMVEWEKSELVRNYTKHSNTVLEQIMINAAERGNMVTREPVKVDANRLEQSLRDYCYVCTEPIRIAVVPPCIHVVCSRCFPSIYPNTRCAMCRSEHLLSECFAVKMLNDDVEDIHDYHNEQTEEEEWGNPREIQSSRSRSQEEQDKTGDIVARIIRQVFNDLGHKECKESLKLSPPQPIELQTGSEIAREYSKLKHILIPVFNTEHIIHPRHYTSKEQIQVETAILAASVLKGSAIQFITVSKDIPNQLPSLPIVIAFVFDENVFLDHHIMNEGLADIQQVIILPYIDGSLYAQSEICRRLSKRGVQQSLIRV